MTTPFPYQLKGVRKLHHFDGRALLADEMGLGKSFQALMYAHEKPLVSPVLIVCPASLKWNWQGEALKHYGLRADILEGTSPPRRHLKLNHHLTIINYDILKAWMPYLKDLAPELIILDECHYIKSMTALRTKLVYELCEGVDHVIGLSGTPLTNRPAEMWSILHLLRPDVFNSWMHYAKRYCKPVKKWYGWTYKGATNLEELHGIASETCMIRRRKRDVLSQLPDKLRTVVPLDIDDRKQYKKAENEFISWLWEQSKSRASRASKAEELVKSGYLKRLAAKLKLESVQGWVDDFLEESDDKLIVFAIHKSVISALRERYKKRCVVLDGESTSKQRQHAFDQFHNDKDTRVFIGNVQAAGVGWSAKCTSTVVFAELGWTPGEHVQAEDRIHGLGRGVDGQTASCYYLVAKGTIEERLCRLLQDKQSVLDRTLDGAATGDLDIYQQLLEELKHAT